MPSAENADTAAVASNRLCRESVPMSPAFSIEIFSHTIGHGNRKKNVSLGNAEVDDTLRTRQLDSSREQV